ncbi:hypothetical protein [Aestuariispira insulae]|uniref:Uncharacterized protein n=1 Tax=Aestuariispira insulae TaxID=1461337 RepID=A0A3D9H5A0_9PROT|nr:hypothetical protein [Aestuariispira insulae]RED44685.1 hypothetical protein DFP90_11447 [Aestuariispira insulae]
MLFSALAMLSLTACTAMLVDSMVQVPNYPKQAAVAHEKLGNCIVTGLRDVAIPDLLGPNKIYDEATGESFGPVYVIRPNFNIVHVGPFGATSASRSNPWQMSLTALEGGQTEINVKSNYNKLHDIYEAPLEDLDRLINECSA